jgi:hypothetical protein
MDDRDFEMDGESTPMRPGFRAELLTTVLDAWRNDGAEVRVAAVAAERRQRRWMTPVGAILVAASVVGGLIVIGRAGGPEETPLATDPEPSVVSESTDVEGTVVDGSVVDGTAVTTPQTPASTAFDIDMYARVWTELVPTVVRTLPGEEVVQAALDPAGTVLLLHATTASDEPQPITVESISGGVTRVVPMPNVTEGGIATASIAGMVAGPKGTIYLDLRTTTGDRSVVAIGEDRSTYDVRSEAKPLDPVNGAALPPPLEPLPGGVGVGGTVALPWLAAAAQGSDPGILPGPTVTVSLDSITVTVRRTDADREVTWNLGYKDLVIDQLRAFPTDDGGAVVGLAGHEGDLRAMEFTLLRPDGTVDRFAQLMVEDGVPVGVSGTTAYYLAGPVGQRTLYSAPLIPDSALDGQTVGSEEPASSVVDSTPPAAPVVTVLGVDPADPPPSGPGVVIGATYDYELYVHCGVEWARIDGGWWQTALLDDGNRNPPAGWGNPSDQGKLTIIDAATAQYIGQAGVAVTFIRTPAVGSPFSCD